MEHFGEPVATITYRKHGNQKLWTAQELRDPAVYACRLIVSRRWAGNEIGAALIDWAGYQALQAWKARWIRIDVWKDNFALHNYYEKYGFAHVRTWQFDDPGSSPSTALFQKPTAEVDEVAATQFSQAIVGPLEQDKTSRPPTTEESLPRSAEPRAQTPARHRPWPGPNSISVMLILEDSRAGIPLSKRSEILLQEPTVFISGLPAISLQRKPSRYRADCEAIDALLQIVLTIALHEPGSGYPVEPGASAREGGDGAHDA